MILHRGRQGFLLVEVLLAIVILVGGALFVMQSFLVSQRALQSANELFAASLLLEKKMGEFTTEGEIGAGIFRGDFPEDEEQLFAWAAESVRLEGSDLNLVTLKVFRKKDGPGGGYSVTTYLKNKPDAEEK